MKYILYKSDADIADINLLELLRVSRKNNKKVNVTGVLITHGKGFIQYIEGAEKNIDNLFHEKICQDTRHQNITIINQAPVLERHFVNWDMGYLCLKDSSELGQIIGESTGIDLPRFFDFVERSLPLVD